MVSFNVQYTRHNLLKYLIDDLKKGNSDYVLRERVMQIKIATRKLLP